MSGGRASLRARWRASTLAWCSPRSDRGVSGSRMSRSSRPAPRLRASASATLPMLSPWRTSTSSSTCIPAAPPDRSVRSSDTRPPSLIAVPTSRRPLAKGYPAGAAPSPVSLRTAGDGYEEGRRGRARGAGRLSHSWHTLEGAHMSTDVIVLRKEDHQEVRKQFRAFRKSGQTAVQKQGIVDTILELLTVHTYIENEVMYPRVR